MATYVMMGRYTTQGLQGLSADRTVLARAIYEKHGGTMQTMYGLLGGTDLMVIADLPDTAAAMKASMAMTKLTGVGFATMPAVDIAEFDRLAAES